ncbi:MAG TPA: hypothetical protein PLB45_04960 [Bacilli bacterium]|nr:hypothetical protein [Bacilli bacterium]HPZ23600.1 hypothetical protein [Bacilli bacterium]HQC84196.1 hypothetical protein [Bacilli bacterium]
MGNYLIPANSKRSMLILGIFNTIDLIIFGIGAFLTFMLLITLKAETMSDVIIICVPLIVTGIMVVPVPNQHNVWTMTANIYGYLTKQRRYRWKGWCVNYGKEERED